MFTLIGVGAFVLVLFLIALFLATRYVRCPGNQVLVVQGKVGEGQAVKCYHGGATFIWPLIQEASFLDLTPLTINIPLKGALSLQNIRVNVPSTFTIAVDTDPDTMNNAAVRLLQLNSTEVELMANEIIFGQLRLTIASLRIEEINQDRERFLESIRNNIDPELRKIGLTLINVNITDITDESGYIESIGKKAASTALNQAKIDVAQQEKLGEVGRAEADKERRVQVASFDAAAVEGENTAKARVAAYDADLQEQEAIAKQRGEVADQKAITEIEIERAKAEQRRLEAEEVVQIEINKRKIEINAAASAARQRLEAEGEAAAILSVQTATAEGINKVLTAKADGYNKLVNSCENPKDAATMLIVEKLDEIVGLQTEAIKNIKIDKVTVWDNGSGEKGSSTANFMSNMVKSLPALHDVAGMAGIDLPRYLGDVQPEALKEDRLDAEV